MPAVIETSVVIIGGGLVGATLASALAPLLHQYQKSLSLIEAVTQESSAQQPSFDGRFTALGYGSKRILDQLDLWQRQAPLMGFAKKASSIEHVHVKQRHYFGTTYLDCEDLGVEALGYVVPNQWMGQVLNAKLEQLPINRYAPAEVTTLEPDARGFLIHLRDGRTLSAELVILADGGRSTLKQQLGIVDAVKDYHQSALIAELSTEYEHQHIAYECFSASGPIALLPSAPKRMALVWTLTPEDLAQKLALPDAEFLSAIQKSFGDRLGQFKAVSKRSHYPLKQVIAREQIRPHLALLGNAAHSMHPVAGQGFNLALRGAMDLAQVIQTTLERHQTLGSLVMLQEFEQKRRADRDFMMRACDQLVNIFGASFPLLAPLRSTALFALNFNRPLRQAIARRAMGLVRAF